MELNSLSFAKSTQDNTTGKHQNQESSGEKNVSMAFASEMKL
jgi:hypothetical protein